MSIELNFSNLLLIILLFFVFILFVMVIFLLLKNNKKSNDGLYFKEEIDNLEKNLIKNDNDNFVKMIEKINNNDKVLSNQIQQNLNVIRETNENKLSEIRNENEKRLNIIQSNINEKLDKSLNERLDSSFKNISDQLGNLYSSLGELQTLSSGVSSLNKTLSNVKTTGIFGEEQLESILENIMTREQYEKQFKINNDDNKVVDYAIKIPNKVGDGVVYLPIDCKFPISRYENLLKAYNECDSKLIEKERNELKLKVINDAKSIKEKYINVPITTEFAIMYVPTESLFCECISIPGLNEDLRNKHNIILSGPTTITALISSLSVGFKFLQINKSSRKVYDILQTIKKQYELFGKEIEKAQSSLKSAKDATDKIEKRHETINSRLKKMELGDSFDNPIEIEIDKNANINNEDIDIGG